VRPVAALLTDFGHQDPFVGVMKGVLAGRCPEAQVIDLCHEVPRQDVRAGALHLLAAVPYFPDGTLFVCVVDPGVGSRRRVLWARGERHAFLFPDNGLLSWAERVEPLREVRKVSSKRVMLRPVSSTFHGRDIFAPAAAALLRGLDPALLGPRIASRVRLRFPVPRGSKRGLRGEILGLDRFGNAVTNLRRGDVPRGAALFVGDRPVGPLRRAYASVRPGRPAVVVGSAGFIELSVRDGSFAERFNAGAGEAVHVR